jgi:hypothetical protein
MSGSLIRRHLQEVIGLSEKQSQLVVECLLFKPRPGTQPAYWAYVPPNQVAEFYHKLCLFDDIEVYWVNQREWRMASILQKSNHKIRVQFVGMDEVREEDEDLSEVTTFNRIRLPQPTFETLLKQSSLSSSNGSGGSGGLIRCTKGHVMRDDCGKQKGGVSINCARCHIQDIHLGSHYHTCDSCQPFGYYCEECVVKLLVGVTPQPKATTLQQLGCNSESELDDQILQMSLLESKRSEAKRPPVMDDTIQHVLKRSAWEGLNTDGVVSVRKPPTPIPPVTVLNPDDKTKLEAEELAKRVQMYKEQRDLQLAIAASLNGGAAPGDVAVPNKEPHPSEDEATLDEWPEID